MESGNGMAEAERWLTIAAKLLAARELHGTRTFAIRARDSDPRNEGSSQILAIADTLLAGDSLVNDHPNWYGVLQLARLTRDPNLIATQYRKLALLLNPVRNKLAFADQALKLVYDAWTVLSNPEKKSIYDNELQMNQLGQLGQLGQLSPNQQRQPLIPNHNRQPQTPVRKSPRNKDGTAAVAEEGPSLPESTRPARANRTPETESQPKRPANSKTRPISAAEPASEVPSFWTACPYCYVLFEYPKVYEECTLRCQNCQRAFHAVVIAPPPVAEGKDSYFCSWGFFPLGFMGNSKDTGGASNWSPISAMFACPLQGDGKPPAKRSFSAGKKGLGRPRKNAYREDQEVYIDISDLSDHSKDDDDDEWDGGSNKKKVKNGKGKGMVGRPPKNGHLERRLTRASNNAGGSNNAAKASNNAGGSNNAAQEGEIVVVHALRADANMNLVSSSGKKHSTKAAKDLGKLDLNVEFSNDVEEPAQGSKGNGARNGEEDNIEGNGFFEGLDEFLSSLPILSVVGDDKVKAS